MKAVRKSFPTVAEALSQIQNSLIAAPVGPPGPVGLSLGDIIVCETVFQRRDTFGNRHGREEHVRDLKRAIQDSPETMEPIDVWWGGDGWYLLDGHHRVLAYESLNFSGSVPVRAIGGSLADALAHVGKANTRNKLPMSLDERNNLAVFYVCLFPQKSHREIAGMSGVGKSNVGNMKKAIDQVIALGHPRESLLGTSWYEIQRMARGAYESNYDRDGEMRKTANEIKQALGPVLGKKPHLKVEALAMALEEISPALYRGLIDWVGPSETFEEDPEDAEY